MFVKMKIFSGFILMTFGFLANVDAATWYTAFSGGDISGNIWATTTNGMPGPISPALVSGDILYIDDNTRSDGNFNTWSSLNITIYLNATLTFGSGGQLDLGDASRIIFQSSSAKIVAEGGGSSNKINFGGGTSEWTGQNGTLTGPGSLDTNSDGALPVELTSFKVFTQDSDVVLNWSTASQLNFDYFILQHSTNGLVWAVLTHVQGAGTTNEKLNYSFQHTSPVAGKNYYRLKSIDFDETFEYSFIIAAEVEIEKEISIYPNPAASDNVVLYELNFTPQENDEIVIYDIKGLAVAQVKVNSIKDTLGLSSSLKSGTYLIKYLSNTEVLTKRLVIK
jgi:hypothetical protein